MLKFAYLLDKHHLKPFAYIVSKIIRVIFSADIPPSLNPEEIRFPHGALGVVIHKDAVIRSGCTIYQNVTIGGNGKAKGNGIPHLSNNVKVFAGAVIVGPIEIGENVIVGANTVITKNIPENSVVYGNPNIIERKSNVYD